MLAYIVRRLALMIPTLLGIMIINFAIVQLAPGGPIEQIIAEVTGTDAGTTGRISGGGSEIAGGGTRQPAHRLRPPIAAIAAPRASTRNSSRTWSASSASTSRCTNGS